MGESLSPVHYPFLSEIVGPGKADGFRLGEVVEISHKVKGEMTVKGYCVVDALPRFKERAAEEQPDEMYAYRRVVALMNVDGAAFIIGPPDQRAINVVKSF